MTKFGTVMCHDPADVLSKLNFTLLKFQYDGHLPSRKSKKNHDLKIICTDFSRIYCADA